MPQAIRTKGMSVHSSRAGLRVSHRYSQIPVRRTTRAIWASHKQTRVKKDEGILTVRDLKVGKQYEVAQALSGVGAADNKVYLLVTCKGRNKQWAGRCVLEVDSVQDVFGWNHPIRRGDIIRRAKQHRADKDALKITVRHPLSKEEEEVVVS